MRSGRALNVGGIVAGELTESQAALRIYLAAGGLALLGLVLAVLTVWWWRSTRPEPPALAPLEVMSARRWTSARESDRGRMVDASRPEGAASARPPEPEPVDLSELARDRPSGFDDLREQEQPTVTDEELDGLLAIDPLLQRSSSND